MRAISTSDQKRTQTEVRKKWFDLKTSSKKNIWNCKEESLKTGVGQNKVVPFTEMHYKVVDIPGRESLKELVEVLILPMVTQSTDNGKLLQNQLCKPKC